MADKQDDLAGDLAKLRSQADMLSTPPADEELLGWAEAFRRIASRVETMQAEIERLSLRLARQNNALTMSNNARDGIAAGLRQQIEKAREAANTLQSEREANAILTAENERLQIVARSANDIVHSQSAERDQLLVSIAKSNIETGRLERRIVELMGQVEINASENERLRNDIETYQRIVQEKDDELAQKEPDMRHPKIQALIGAKARREIEMSIVDDLLNDADHEPTAMDMEYWTSTHDRLQERLEELAQAKRDAERLMSFAALILHASREQMTDVDGGDVQALGIKAGLLVPVAVEEPCDAEMCHCSWTSDFPTTCYRYSPEVSAVLQTQEQGGDGHERS